MDLKVLVLYASVRGSTQNIAEHISSRITATKPPLGTITCLPITDPPKDTEISTYDAIIIGSAIHNLTWLPSATSFLTSHLSTANANTSSNPSSTSPSKEVIPSSTITPKAGLWAFSVGCPKSLPKILVKSFTAMENEEEIVRNELVEEYGLELKGHGFFGGVAGKDMIPRKFRWLYSCFGGKFEDFRDWEVIDSWTDGVVESLRGG